MSENNMSICNRKNFGISHGRPGIFATCLWQPTMKPSARYMVYRFILSLIFVAILMLKVVKRHMENDIVIAWKWIIFVSNWSFTVCMLQAVFCSVLLAMRLASIKSEGVSVVITVTSADKEVRNVYSYAENDMHGYTSLYKMYWMLNTIGTNFSIFTTIIYWFALHPAADLEVTYMVILFYGVDTILMMIDFFLTAHPVQLLHFYLPLGFFFVYSLFTFVYYQCGGTLRQNVYIYPCLNWTEPLRACLYITISAVIVLAIHLLLYVLSLFKIWFADVVTIKCFYKSTL